MARGGDVAVWRRTPCASSVSIESAEALRALCYPRPAGDCWARLEAIRRSGVEEVCTDLKEYPGGARLLGRGHTASVALARVPGGFVAVKSLRTDAGVSLEGECRLAATAARAGAAPRVHYCDDKIMVMDAVLGPTLEAALSRDGFPVEVLVAAALDAARALDAAEVLHYEIHRPWRNVLFTSQPPLTAVIVDYDSAGRGCGNVARIAQALLRRLAGTVDEALDALRAYKKLCTRGAYYELRNIVLEIITLRRGDSPKRGPGR